jgi:hypothetical protein
MQTLICAALLVVAVLLLAQAVADVWRGAAW